MKDTSQYPYTLFLVGAGADDGGWTPVIKAINKTINKTGGTTQIQHPEDANFYLAQHVYERRMCAAIKRRHGSHSPENIAQQEKDGEIRDRVLKTAIADHLKEATSLGALKLRAEFLKTINDPQFGRNKVFLTANWDLLLERELKSSAKVHHIHGTVSDPDNLFLPSETTQEDYRSAEQYKAMGGQLATLWQTVASAERICIFGLSLSPLDAELTFAISTGINHKPGFKRRITIIALPKDIDSIKVRIMLLSEHSTDLIFDP